MLNMIKMDLYRMFRTKKYVCSMDRAGSIIIAYNIYVQNRL